MPRAVDGIKVCSMCKVVKPVSDFGFDKKNADRLKSQCKPCLANYERARNAIKGAKALQRKPFSYRLLDEFTAEIPVRNDGSWVFALVDVKDAEYISQFAWGLDRTGYARAVIDDKSVSMHRLLLKLEADDTRRVVDHINRKRLDNRVSVNLRVVDKGLNARNVKKVRADNKSGYTGVHFHQKLKKWIAFTSVKRKRHHIGVFDTAIEAARAYDAFIKSLNLPPPYFLNFPNE